MQPCEDSTNSRASKVGQSLPSGSPPNTTSPERAPSNVANGTPLSIQLLESHLRRRSAGGVVSRRVAPSGGVAQRGREQMVTDSCTNSREE